MTERAVYSIIQVVSGVLLGIMIVSYTIYNVPVLYSLAKNTFNNLSEGNLQELFSTVDTQYKQSVRYKNVLTDIYGFAQRVLNKFIIGEYEYLYQDGYMHRIQEYGYGEDAFLAEIISLNQQLAQDGIPFLYVQGVNREAMIGGSKAIAFNIDQQCMDHMVNVLIDNEVAVLDARELFVNSSYDLDKVFLRTDLHMQTDAEIFMARELCRYFSEQFGKIPDAEYLLEDMSYYEKHTYPFFGNYSRNVGEYYMKEDLFDLYYPKFDTSFLRIDQVSGVEVTGAFQDVIMNQYEDQEIIDKYTYWVTDYMQFTNPYYTIINYNNPGGDKYLFIMDSIGYRTVSYLSLTASEITILDPRFFNGEDYLSLALNEREYDAVVLYQGTFLLGNKLYP